MKRLYILLLLLPLLLISCKFQQSGLWRDNAIESISKPQNDKVPLRGTWLVNYIKPIHAIQPQPASKYQTGEKLYIDNKLVGFMNRYTIKPSFQSKYVNANDFFKKKFDLSVKSLGYNEENMKIVTVRDEQLFDQDFFVVDESHLFLAYDGQFFFLEKTADSVDSNIISQFKQEAQVLNTGIIDIPSEDSGPALLLGIKSLISQEQGVPVYDYRTYLISISGNSPVRVNCYQDLFVPRSSGFWTIGIDRSTSDSVVHDEIFATPISEDDRQQNRTNDSNSPQIRSIQYVGNDYIALENMMYLQAEHKRYGIFNLDQLSKDKPLEITEIAGDEGKEIYEDTILKEQKDLLLTDSNIEFEDAIASNIGIYRKTGRWTFKSNLTLTQAANVKLTDFALNIIPLINIFSDNQLFIPWIEIKNKFPDAIDALTSPNHNYLIIQDTSQLLIYDVNNFVIGEQPIITIPLNENDKIIMAEWSVGRLASMWELELQGQTTIPVDLQN